MRASVRYRAQQCRVATPFEMAINPFSRCAGEGGPQGRMRETFDGVAIVAVRAADPERYRTFPSSACGTFSREREKGFIARISN
jgi:hypothetical protein